MNREALTTLADRAESAGAEEQRELLIDAGFEIVCGGSFAAKEGEWPDDRQARLVKMLDAEAFESAVAMLYDKWDHAQVYRPDHQSLKWEVQLHSNANLSRDFHTGFGETQALAWFAAICRAVAQGEG